MGMLGVLVVCGGETKRKVLQILEKIFDVLDI